MAGAAHSTKDYYKTYFILLILFVISVLGPEIGIRTVTLITAFGIAIVKALMVAKHFMHLNIEKKIIWYMFLSMLLMVALFFIGVASDVMKVDGQNWENKAAENLIKERSANGGSSTPH